MDSKTVYFDKPGKDNTEAVFQIARQRAGELGIKTIIVASTTGETAAKAVDAFKGLKVVIVTHVMGSREANVQPMSEENRRIVVAGGECW